MKKRILGLALLAVLSSATYSQDAVDLLKNSTKYIDQPHLIVDLDKDNSSESIDITFVEDAKFNSFNFTGKIKPLSSTRKQLLKKRFDAFIIKEVEVAHQNSREWHVLLLKDGEQRPLAKERTVNVLGVIKYPNEKGFMILKPSNKDSK